MHEWSPQQDRALMAVRRWLQDKNGKKVFRLFGYAGTGKTTLARHLAEGVDGRVCFAAYTGKAAHVLSQKGCEGARTIHSLIYTSRTRSAEQQVKLEKELQVAQGALEALGPEPAPTTATFMGKPREVRSQPHLNAERQVKTLTELLEAEKRASKRPSFLLNPASEVVGAALVVIDECSMVDERIGHDLESFGVKILVLGDPAQLPPVGGGGYFTDPRYGECDILLTEIHRQAAESPILRLATRARNNQVIALGEYGDGVRVVTTADLDPRTATLADQILCGRNATRHAANHRYRHLTGIGGGSPFPVSGDKLVCLRNDHELGLLNGSLWRVHESVRDEESRRVIMTISSEDSSGSVGVPVEAHDHHFLGAEEELKAQGWTRRDAQEFDMGYALTVHKSQGSQWDEVLLLNEMFAFKQHPERWLYTGITRAAKALTIVRM